MQDQKIAAFGSSYTDIVSTVCKSRARWMRCLRCTKRWGGAGKRS